MPYIKIGSKTVPRRTEYVIEKNVPMPHSARPKDHSVEHHRIMSSIEIGDSFEVPSKWRADRARKWAKANGRVFETRKILDTIRVWRTA